MKKLISFCVNHAISVMMIILCIVLCGILSIFTIRFDFLPLIGERHLLVTTQFEGIPANEMKKLVTIPLEDSVASLKGIKSIESVTRDGISLITIELHLGTNIQVSLTECREIIDSSFEALPSNCEKPIVKIFNPNQTEDFTLCIKSLDSDLKYCRYIADYDIKPRLQRIPGVLSVAVSGGLKEEVHVVLNREKTESSLLSLQNVSDTIAESNFEYPAGLITEGNKELIFKTSGLFDNLTEIEEIPLLNTNSGIIRLSDIGKVENSNKEKESFFTYNGEECISISILKKTDSSPVSLSKAIKAEVDNLNYLYGNFFSFEIINDQSIQLKSALKNLLSSAIVGILITFIILFIFFRTSKTSLLAASMIPLSILFSIIILKVFGRTLNILSLSGITVGIGMVVDPATVVIENIHKKLSSKNNINDVIVSSTNEVSLSSLGSALTTIIVFIPFFFLNGLLGKLFKDISIAVISAIAFSCILAMTYIPASYSILNRKGKLTQGISLNKVESLYEKVLSHFFAKKFFTILVLSFSSFIGILLALNIKKELLPLTMNNEINATIIYSDGTSLSKLQDDADKLYFELSNLQNIKNVRITGGIDSKNYEKLSNPKLKNEILQLSFETTNVKKTTQYLNTILPAISENYSIYSGKDILSSLINIEKNLYLINAEDEEQLDFAINNIVTEGDELIPNNIILENVFTPDRTACSRYNIGAINTAIIAHNTLEGIYSTYMYKNGRQIPVKVMYPKNSITTIEQLLETNIVLDKIIIPLKSLGYFHKENSNKIIYRNNRQDSKRIKINTNREIKESKNIISIEKESINELFNNTLVLLGIILLLLYFVMGAQFESFSIPIFILLSIPTAFAGAFFALLVFGQTININSVIALVVLFGLSVNNAIILYEAIREIKIFNPQNVIKESSGRIRAILVTSLTTIFALIPFAIDPFHKNAQASMAIAIIGGLLTSLFATVLIIPPILFKVLEKRKHNESNKLV